MASDALWVVSFKCVMKRYQECRFDVIEGIRMGKGKNTVSRGNDARGGYSHKVRIGVCREGS